MGWFNFHVPETRRPDRNAGQAGNIGSGAVEIMLPAVDRGVNLFCSRDPDCPGRCERGFVSWRTARPDNPDPDA